MKTGERNFAVNALSMAVRGALLAMCAVPLAALADDAADGDLKALISPTNQIDVGVLNVSKDSSKFGEYNGLNNGQGYLLGNFNVRGGNSYGMGDGTYRWEAFGTDLGTTSRALGVSVGNQGQWSLGVGFDQLRHYTTGGTYQTPYQGDMGGNTFVLPPAFGIINTTAPGTRTLAGNQLASFRTEDIYAQRTNTSFRAGYSFNPQWNVKFDFNRLDQTGAKLIGAATDGYTGGPGGLTYGAERIVILMNPTKYQTDTLNLGLNWVGEKAHWSASYDGSFFHDDFTSMSFSNPYVATGTTGTALAAPAFPVNNMSTAPSNEFHQLSLTGGYNLAAATKLSGGLSFGRNTQNENYAGTYTTTPNTVTTLPVASLNGLVNTTHADLKLTHQATKALALMAAVKYNERDNHTASNTYVFIHLAGASATVVNIPMSNRRTQFELAGDYRLSPRQRLHLGYEYDMIKRWCNNPLANNAQGAGPSSYYTTASCAQVPESDESRVNLTYKLKASETIDLNAGYTYSNRKSEVNSSFYNPLQSRTSGYENYGYLAFFQASRKQDLYKAGVTWEATDRLNLGLNGRYTRDDYDSLLGVQSGQSGSVNLDGTYSFSETSTISAYGTWQTRRRDLLTANGRSTTALLPNLWTNNLTEEDRTVGISGRQKGFLGGKLDLGEDLTFSAAKSRYATDLYYINTTVGNKGITPDIKSELTQLRFTGSYHVDKASTVVLGYTFQRLSSVDYMYNGFQYGYTPTTLLSTNQQAPNYIIHAIFGTYSYTFQ